MMNTSTDSSWNQKNPIIKVSDAYNGILDDMDEILSQISPDFSGWVGMDYQIKTEGEKAIQNNSDISFEELKDVLRQVLKTRGKVEFVIMQAMKGVNYAKQDNGEYHARPIIISRSNILRSAAREILEAEPDIDQGSLTIRLQRIAETKFN